jgi:RNA recognition motif-containing protein
MNRKLYVGGVPFSTSTDGLRALFAEVGVVESITLVADQLGQSRGFGYVEMASAEAAAAVIKKFDRQELGGRQLRVQLAR